MKPSTTLLRVEKKQRLMKALEYELVRLPPREYADFLRGTKECPITGVPQLYCICDMCIRDL